jgi:glycosyltransferase involved in cell wall biosynthesis
MAIRSEAGLLSLFRLAVLLRRVRPQIIAFNTPRAIIVGNLASKFSTVRARVIFRRVNFPLRWNPLTHLKYTWGIDCIVAISESIRSQLLVRGIPPGLIRIVYEGMDLAQYPKLDKPVVRPGEPVIVGTIAHLSSEKGINHLIEAAALIPEVRSRMRFLVVGDGNCRRELQEQVRTANLETCFQFAGFQENTGAYLASFDIFVLPSLSEGLSSSILSAMASSLPVVATKIGGIPELVRHGDNGLLVPAADPPALAQALQCLAENPSERFRMGQRGRTRMQEEFTLQRKIEETERLCHSLLQHR